jgi:hypothetical protein
LGKVPEETVSAGELGEFMSKLERAGEVMWAGGLGRENAVLPKKSGSHITISGDFAASGTFS